jgi:hypothetical protein
MDFLSCESVHFKLICSLPGLEFFLGSQNDCDHIVVRLLVISY